MVMGEVYVGFTRDVYVGFIKPLAGLWVFRVLGHEP